MMDGGYFRKRLSFSLKVTDRDVLNTRVTLIEVAQIRFLRMVDRMHKGHVRKPRTGYPLKAIHMNDGALLRCITHRPGRTRQLPQSGRGVIRDWPLRMRIDPAFLRSN